MNNPIETTEVLLFIKFWTCQHVSLVDVDVGGHEGTLVQILLLDGCRDFQCRVAFEESAWVWLGPTGNFEG